MRRGPSRSATGRADGSPLVFAAIGPLLLGGLLPLSPDISNRWCVAGRWTFPVGDPLALGSAGPFGEQPFQVTRNIQSGGDRHSGADISNRTAGDTVRAAAHGIVVAAQDAGSGYGLHVVLAHRLPDGSLVMSVYAHLARGSLNVSPGESVLMGRPLGLVGRSGTATSPHLHFEVRKPFLWDERWEKSPTLDPVRFVTAALPSRERDSTWARPYLQWAECAGIVTPGEHGETMVTRERWRRVVAAAGCRGEDLVGPPPPPLSEADEPVTWREIARDLDRLRKAGLCLPRDTTANARRRSDCDRRLGMRDPSRDPDELGARRALCTIAELALVMSDFSGR